MVGSRSKDPKDSKRPGSKSPTLPSPLAGAVLIAAVLLHLGVAIDHFVPNGSGFDSGLRRTSLLSCSLCH